jgi:hypothetical protein
MTSESSQIAETASHAIHHVPAEVTLLFTSLLVALIVSLAFEEKLHAKKSLIVGVFSVVCLLLGAYFNLLPFGELILPNGHRVYSGCGLGCYRHYPWFKSFC